MVRYAHAWIAAVAAGLVGNTALADDALIAAAKKEGQVVWYTAQIINQLAQPVAVAFEKRYGVRVNPVRSDAAEIVLRITNEAKAGALQADVFDGTASAPPLKRAGLVMKWQPETAKNFPPQFLDKDGYWTANNLYIIAPSFNTQLVPRGTEPKAWNDLLDPKYKGKIAVSSGASTSGGAGLVGVVLHDMGEEKGMDFLRRLAMQRVAVIASSARTVTDQVMQGEYAVGLMMSNNQPVSSARQGAPVDTLPWSSSIAAMNAAGLLKDAPHPNAGKLLMEFLVSEEGQRLFAAADYLPVNPTVPAKEPRLKPEVGNFTVLYMTPEEVDTRMGEWDKIFKGLFK
jgi:ABC-type Fe3+ transport system substrate-binding protein